MENTTTFRPVTPQDIDTIVSLMQDFYAIDGYPIDPENRNSFFKHSSTMKTLEKPG